MIKGNDCWPQNVISGMDTTTIAGRELSIYMGIPASLYHMLMDTAEKFYDKTAMIDNWNRAYSFSELLEKVDRFADYLYGIGIRKSSHVGLLLYNSVEFAVAFLALTKLRAITVPLPSKYQKPEVLSLAGKAEVSTVICDEAFASWFTGDTAQWKLVLCRNYAKKYGFSYLFAGHTPAPAKFDEPSPLDSVIIMFTSGTTSQSKGVLLKNYNITHTIEAYRRIFRVTDSDRSLIATPIYHITGMIALLGLFVYVGGTLWITNKVDPRRMLQIVLTHNLTFIHASPTVFHLLLEQRDAFPALPSLSRFACGSSNMPAGSIRKIKSWLPQVSFYTIYGMTEVSSPATTFPSDAAGSPYIESSGVPIPGLDIKILDDSGNELENGQLGEITMYGTGVLETYYNMASPCITKDGWLRSGDIGYLNDAGYLWIVDRKKDMINRGGEKICAYDVENELHNIPEINEAVVVGVPDAKYYEVPVAAIKLEKGKTLTEEQICQFLHSRLAKYKIPTRFCFVEEMPKTINGKPDKVGVRKLFTD